MIGPRDPVPQFGVPVHADTGLPLTDNQKRHLDAIRQAGELLYSVMHDAEGSTMPGEHQEHSWSGRRMAHAATMVETGLMFARKAALER
jgi:hypothetical protein